MNRPLVVTVLLFGALPARLAFAQDPSSAPPPEARPDAPSQAPTDAESRAAATADAAGPAEPAPDDPKKDKQKPAAEEREHEVRIIGNRADALQKVAGSGTVIGAKDLKRAQPVDTAEMLRRVPGVTVRQSYEGGSRIDISIRGLESGRSRRVLLLEDGIPIALNPYSEPDMNHAPPIERYRGIEVVKGAGNILFGPQTLSGTINFITLAPPDRPTVTADLDVGDYGYVRGLANYGDTIGDARYVVQVLHRRGDGMRAQPFDSTNGLAKVIIPTSRDGEAVVRLGFHRDDAASEDIGMTRDMFRRDPRRPTLSPAAHTVLNRFDAAIIHEQRFSSKTKLKTLVYGYTTDRIWRRPQWRSNPAVGERYDRIVGDVTIPGGATFFLPSNTILDRDYDVIGFEPRFEHHAETFGVGHTLEFGGRVLREQAHYQQRNGGYPETYSGALEFEQKRVSWGTAGYVQDRIAFRDDLLVTPGIRVEHVDLRTITLRQSGIDQFDEGKDGVTGVIPGVGMVYGQKTANVFGGVHYGFAPPRVTSSISPRGRPSSVSGDRGIHYEVGGRAQVTKWLRGETTGFLSNFSNQVIVNTRPGEDTQLTDAGATMIRGVESGAQLSIDKLLGLGTTIELGARYTFSRATFRHGTDAGNLLPYAPEHSFNTNFDVEHPIGVGGQVAYAFLGPQFSDAANTREEDVRGNLGLIESRHIVDATVHYRIKSSGITLRLTAKNLLDSTYIIARRPEGIFPGPYRQLLVGLRWEWGFAKRE